MTQLSRRSFLAAVGGSAAALWFTAEASDLIAAGTHAAQAALPPFLVLSAADAMDLEAATSQIIPTDDTPGAREARVVYFIDKSLATFAAAQRDTFTAGLKELRARAAKQQRGAKSFAALSDANQHVVLDAMQKAHHPFFPVLRGATLSGMFANPEYGGNFQKSGWKLIGFNDQFSWAAPFGWYDRNA